jgi:hypothetical protein
MSRKWGINVKGNKCQKVVSAAIVTGTLKLWRLDTKNKCSYEQASKQNDSQHKQLRVENTEIRTYTKSMWILSFVQIQRQLNVIFMQHNYSMRGWNLSPASAGVFEWHGGIGFLYCEELHFARSYHYILRRCWWNTHVSWYAIQLHSQWCMFRISCHKNIKKWKYASDCNVDRVGT